MLLLWCILKWWHVFGAEQACIAWRHILRPVKKQQPIDSHCDDSTPPLAVLMAVTWRFQSRNFTDADTKTSQHVVTRTSDGRRKGPVDIIFDLDGRLICLNETSYIWYPNKWSGPARMEPVYEMEMLPHQNGLPNLEYQIFSFLAYKRLYND